MVGMGIKKDKIAGVAQKIRNEIVAEKNTR
jgi:hypothetical protein